MFKVALLESQAALELPHIAMALMYGDLKRRDDLEVHATRVNLAAIEQSLDFIEQGKFDLVVMDCRFPLNYPSRIKERSPQTLVVTGGLGFYNMLTKGRADFAVQGPGRRSLPKLIDILIEGGNDFREVPNLFFWVDMPTSGFGPGGGPIDCSEVELGYDLNTELEPFYPDYEFGILGKDEGEEDPDNWMLMAPPSIIAEYSCPSKYFPLEEDFPALSFELPEADFTDRAVERLRTYMKKRWKGGCSFCVYQQVPSLPIATTLETLMKQATYILKTCGYKSFAIQTETPLRFLTPFLEAFLNSDLKAEKIFIRERARDLCRKRSVLEKAAAMAEEAGFELVVWQVGYESFSQRQLDLYNKNTSVEENVIAADLLRELSRKHPRHFSDLNETHGIVVFNPWTTFDELKENLHALSRTLPERLVIHPVLTSEIELYDPFLPLYRKAMEDGLIVNNDGALDGYRMKDPAMEVVRDCLKALLTEMNLRLPADVRVEVNLLAPRVSRFFDGVIDELGKSLYGNNGSRRSKEQVVETPRKSASEVDLEVRQFLNRFEPNLIAGLDDWVSFVRAVREIRFYGNQALSASQEEIPVLEKEEIDSRIAKTEELFNRIGDTCQFQAIEFNDKVGLKNLITGEHSIMDKIEYAFVKASRRGIDVGQLLREITVHLNDSHGFYLDRAHHAGEFLEACQAS